MISPRLSAELVVQTATALLVGLAVIALSPRLAEDRYYARTAVNVHETVRCFEQRGPASCPRPGTFVGGVSLDQEVRLAGAANRARWQTHTR